MVKVTLPSGNTVETNFANTNPMIDMLLNGTAIFCFCKDNPGIEDKNNDLFYVEKDAGTDMEEGQKVKAFKETITVQSEDGRTVHGRIDHWCPMGGNTDRQGWFVVDTTESGLATAQN